jgi:hypothetical protein
MPRKSLQYKDLRPLDKHPKNAIFNIESREEEGAPEEKTPPPEKSQPTEEEAKREDGAEALGAAEETAPTRPRPEGSKKRKGSRND